MTRPEMKTILVYYKGKVNEWCKLPATHNLAADEKNRLIKAGYPAHLAPENTYISTWIYENGEFRYNEMI